MITPADAVMPGGPDNGDEVEVRTFDGRWSAGFGVVAVAGDAYVVRRQSDGAVLPALFDARDVRPR